MHQRGAGGSAVSVDEPAVAASGEVASGLRPGPEPQGGASRALFSSHAMSENNAHNGLNSERSAPTEATPPLRNSGFQRRAIDRRLLLPDLVPKQHPRRRRQLAEGEAPAALLAGRGPRQADAVDGDRQLLRHLPGGEKLTKWTEAAPYLLAVVVATHSAIFGPIDLMVLGGFSLATWLSEKLSNEVAQRTRATNRRISERFSELSHRQIEQIAAWVDAQAPSAKELSLLEDLGEKLHAAAGEPDDLPVDGAADGLGVVLLLTGGAAILWGNHRAQVFSQSSPGGPFTPDLGGSARTADATKAVIAAL